MSHALRTLMRTPAFAAAAVLTLGLGIAAAGSMFAIVYGVLLAPLPYGRPAQLVDIGLDTVSHGRMQQPPALYFTYRRHATQLADVGFYRTGNANIRRQGADDAPERITATWLTASMVPLLEVPPLLGRSFTADEERPGGTTAAMLSESEWRTRFGASPDVLGQVLMVNDVPREIVGVMPARFAFPNADTRIWLSARLPTDAVVGEFAYAAVGRLKPGARVAQAQQELAALLPGMAETFPRLESGGATAHWLAEVVPKPIVRPLHDALTADIARTLWMLAAAAALVLLVAWANVTNLMLIRADARQNELAVRATLGASRWRIATHFLGESCWLGAAAGVLALFATGGALRAVVAYAPAEIPRLSELGLSLATVGFIALIGAASIALCAAVPALRWQRGRLSERLRDGARGEPAGKPRQRLRMGIAALQIALALVVSLGSALLLRTAQRLNAVHPGFDGHDVTVLWTLLPFARYDDAATVGFHARLVERVRALPSVTAAGLTFQVPLTTTWMQQESFRSEGDARMPSLPVNVVDDGYFATMGIPRLAGRGFRTTAGATTEEIILSRQAVQALFDDADVDTVIGVVGDVRDRQLATAPAAVVYRPQSIPRDAIVEPGPRHTMALVVKSRLPADTLVPAIRDIVRDLDPTVPIFNATTMPEVMRASMARLSLTMALITAAAVVTLLLGAIGLYGVMAYMVALRTREFGVRAALGANPARIATLVAARGLALAAAGMVAGLVLYALTAPLLQSFLYEVTPTDPITLAAATCVLVLTAVLASALPARRAARIAPAEALRAD